ncbi:unnamed protein product [Bursaphelenchus okinawaensis]|uniref:Ion transport domain-containing protein n=1 Tax=Bursaphelenchus okinawaensis TaxID=465554 RepID=A0A811JRD1_9BILA|nr:unnamed protein product [Bursaphelenchus okinawaensis]CAG9079540.1 unnamed protein product [Bursaphelenchus okinawaensis]
MKSNSSSNVREGMYQGSDGKNYMLYNLVDMHGGGDLIPWMRYAIKTGDYSLLDGYLEGAVMVRDMMYNNGKGRIESVSELVKRRNKERNERLGAFSRKKGKGKSGPNILENLDAEVNQQDLKKALKLLDGGKNGKGDAKYREIAWKYESRGSMGETIVGCCLMQASLVHNLLALRLMTMYPPLINDIYISEDYYGLAPIHQAIVNDDSKMLYFLITHGADINQRCYGAFFCPHDQVSSRTDSLEHEYVDVDVETDYQNRMYFGEYPLAFAACVNQIDCFKLLRAKKADPNRQDTNGNTVLHMTVIHENIDMFLLAYESGAKLQVLNKQNLTPLTLSAFLAKKIMFEHLLKIESQVLWERGGTFSISYPLAKIDSIDPDTGDLNDNSVLSLVVYGDSEKHLDLIDGLLEDILKAKWKSFGLKRWIRSLLIFAIHWTCCIAAFLTRPIEMTTVVISGFSLTPEMVPSNDTQYSPDYIKNIQCHLLHYGAQGDLGYARLFFECLSIAFGVGQIVIQSDMIRREGFTKWWKIMRAFPAKIMYFISVILNVLLVPLRFLCFANEIFLTADNVISIICIVLCTVHFLYYCRAIKFIGPFVLMIYTIIMRDLIRFFIIYAVFLMGFSQAFYIVFLAGERIYNQQYEEALKEWNANNVFANGSEDDAPVKHENIMSNPIESLLRLFIATIGEFTTFYRELNAIPERALAVLGKILFMIFEMVVSLMQFNLLIAMMSRTYELIFRTQKEYKRQWAQVILLLEMSLPAKERQDHLLRYSRPIGTDKRKRAFVVIRKAQVLTESERILKMKEEETKRLEKQQVLKRRLRGLMEQTGTTPMPMETGIPTGGTRRRSRRKTEIDGGSRLM